MASRRAWVTPATRSATTCSSSTSWSVNGRSSSRPTWITPRSWSPLSSGIPSITRIRFSQSTGLATVVASTRSSRIGLRVAAIRPAKPAPSGTRTPWRTSGSMPRAARAMSVPELSSSSSTAAVSASRISRTRVEQLAQEVIDVEVGQRRVGERPEVAEVVGCLDRVARHEGIVGTSATDRITPSRDRA